VGMSCYEGHLFLMKYGHKLEYVFWYTLCLVEIFYLSLTSTGSEL
jgi:hypothetical protein